MYIYKDIIKDVFINKLMDGETKDEILKRWENGETDDDFGNLTGSRTYSTYEAEETLKKAGFPFNEEINDLFKYVGYDMGDILTKGAEAIDVIICELLVPEMISELKDYDPTYEVTFSNDKGEIFTSLFEAENETEAKEQAELYLDDEASDFAGNKGYKIESVDFAF